VLLTVTADHVMCFTYPEGKPLPIREGYEPRITSTPAGRELWRGAGGIFAAEMA